MTSRTMRVTDLKVNTHVRTTNLLLTAAFLLSKLEDSKWQRRCGILSSNVDQALKWNPVLSEVECFFKTKQFKSWFMKFWQFKTYWGTQLALLCTMIFSIWKKPCRYLMRQYICALHSCFITAAASGTVYRLQLSDQNSFHIKK